MVWAPPSNAADRTVIEFKALGGILWGSVTKKLLHTSISRSLLDWREELCYFNNSGDEVRVQWLLPL